jgi:sec-independent protein translocase protein TatC
MTRHSNPRAEMPFLDHLEELRWRILWSLLAVTVGAVIGFALVYHFHLLDLLIEPVRRSRDDPAFKLIYLSPADPFVIDLKLGIVVGIILAFPIVVYQVWSFLSPALEKHEKRAIIPSLYLGLFLFLAGVAMAYFVALPMTLEFFKRFEAGVLQDQLEVGKTLGVLVKFMIAFGVVFELPVVVMLLSLVGLVTPESLRHYRRHAIVVMTVVASVVTPGDVVSLTVILMVPLLLLYELSIYLSAVVTRRRRAKEEARERELAASGEAPPGAVERDDVLEPTIRTPGGPSQYGEEE